MASDRTIHSGFFSIGTRGAHSIWGARGQPGTWDKCCTGSALLAVALAGLLCAADAHAALAGNLASVQADALAFGANSSQSVQGAATVLSQALPNGLSVRQYLDAAGTVVAVGWDGPVLPDFERLLGPYFPVYALAVRQQRRGVSIQTPELVIESGGMMRSFSGRAYLPTKLVGTLAAQDIR